MLRSVERNIESYKMWFPQFYEKTDECIPCGRYTLLIILNDGSKLEFNSMDNTIREVTRYYEPNAVMNFEETDWRKEFGRRLRKAIASRGINQDRLSELIGISRPMLSRYVNGTSTPSSYILNRLATILDCDVRELSDFNYMMKD